MFHVLHQSLHLSDLVTRHSPSLDVVALEKCSFVISFITQGNAWRIHNLVAHAERICPQRKEKKNSQLIKQYVKWFASPFLWWTEVNPLISVLSPDLAKVLHFAQISLSTTIQEVCINTYCTEQYKKYHHHHHHHHHHHQNRYHQHHRSNIYHHQNASWRIGL